MRTSQRELVDRITDGQLDKIIGTAASYAVARDILRDEYEVTVSVETLRRWFTTEPSAS